MQCLFPIDVKHRVEALAGIIPTARTRAFWELHGRHALSPQATPTAGLLNSGKSRQDVRHRQPADEVHPLMHRPRLVHLLRVHNGEPRPRLPRTLSCKHRRTARPHGHASSKIRDAYRIQSA
jgi:hypothetical protein